MKTDTWKVAKILEKIRWEHAMSADYTSKSGSSITSELRDTLRIFLPLAIGNLGQAAIGATDIIILGRLGPDALGAAGLALSVYNILLTIGMGILFPVVILVSQARGSGRLSIVPVIVRQGLWIAGMLSVPGCAILWNLEGILLMTGQAPALAGMAGDYMDYFLWTLFPAFGSLVFVLAFTAMGRTGVIVVISWLLVGLNAMLSYVLVFGKLGVPAMGMAGAGLASVIVYGVAHTTFFILFAFHRFFRSHTVFRRAWRPKWAMIGQILRLGLPKGFEMVMKTGLFSVLALLAGWLGVLAIAAHTIAVEIFLLIELVVSAAVASAVTSRTGIAAGRGDYTGLWRILSSGLFLCLFAMLPFVVILKLFSPWVVMVFVGSGPEAQALLPLAALLVVLVAFFALVDGLSMVVAYVLNGLEDMKAPALIAATAYWGIALPAGAVLGFVMEMGVLGLWWGLIMGVVVAGLAYMMRFRWLVREIYVSEKQRF